MARQQQPKPNHFISSFFPLFLFESYAKRTQTHVHIVHAFAALQLYGEYKNRMRANYGQIDVC